MPKLKPVIRCFWIHMPRMTTGRVKATDGGLWAVEAAFDSALKLAEEHAE
jgi:hypothetical protein